MTSTPFTSGVHNTDDHPDVAEISALTEDLLSPERTAALQRHLSTCELCADVRDSLDGIRGSLGTFPGPVRMPDDIAGRIDAALAAEILGDPSPGNASAVSRETKRASRERSRRTKAGWETATTPKHAAGSVSRETASSRTSASSRPADRPTGHPGGTSRPGRHRPVRRTGRWRSAVLAGAGAIAALSIGGLVVQSLNSPAPPSAATNSEHRERTSADGALKKHVQSLLAKEESKGKPRGGGTPDLKSKQSPKDSPLVGGAVSVPSCIRKGIDRTESPLAVDAKAPYKGGTGFLVVLPHRGASQRVDAYIVDSSCISRAGTGPGKVLMTRTYARH